MNYLRPTFTLPTSHNTSELMYDLATLDKFDFRKKYKINVREYEELANGGSLPKAVRRVGRRLPKS